MGRAERRKAGVKGKVRTYTLTDVEIQRIKKEAADAAYQKIMGSAMAEINQQIIENDKKFSADLDATILWVLHERMGFGKTRLRRFWEAFITEHQYLRAVYGDGMGPWKCRDLLQRIGVDVDAWNQELGDEDTKWRTDGNMDSF